MTKDIPTIRIDLDKKCENCNEDGATQNGYCLTCINKAMKKYGYKNWRKAFNK